MGLEFEPEEVEGFSLSLDGEGDFASEEGGERSVQDGREGSEAETSSAGPRRRSSVAFV